MTWCKKVYRRDGNNGKLGKLGRLGRLEKF